MSAAEHSKKKKIVFELDRPTEKFLPKEIAMAFFLFLFCSNVIVVVNVSIEVASKVKFVIYL